MRAYKFRSSKQLPFAFDIIFNNRLYCSELRDLNDPVEGIFAYQYRSTNDDRDGERVADEVAEHTKKMRVCSLSKTFDCHLLWAHYASGFDGLAIEIELPNVDPLVKHVQYRGVFAGVSLDSATHPAEVAEQILSSKYKEWSYEQEVRILQERQWYQLAKPVSRIIVGHRMNSAVFAALRLICASKNISLARTGIGDTGIDADHVPPLSKREMM